MRVLVVDDSPETQSALSAMLTAAGYAVVTASSGEEALELVAHTPFDVMLTDLSLPGMSGIELCWLVRSQSVSEFQYLMVMTALKEIAFHIEALDGGADDFLPKPVDQPVLCARLRLGARVLSQQRALHRLATIDSLSNVLNRRSFLEQSEELVDHCRARRISSVAVMCDIDNFKRINDTYGHAVGDQVIQRVAKTLQQMSCSHDIVGRLGGEEFGILFTAVDLFQALQQTERLRATIERLELDVDGLSVTASFGVAEIMPTDREFAHALRRADGALYRAKAAGRNQVAVDMEAEALARSA